MGEDNIIPQVPLDGDQDRILEETEPVNNKHDTTVFDGVENTIDPLIHKDSDFLWNEKEGATNRITIVNQGKCSHYLQQCAYDFCRKQKCSV